MRRELILSALIFFVLGFLAGHVYTRQSSPSSTPAADVSNPEASSAPADAAGLPPGHPPINTDALLRSLRQAAEQNPDDARAALALADALFDAKRFDEAVFWYKRTLALDAKNENARTDLGSTYYNLNRYDEAIAEFERVLALNPTHAQALYNLAVVKLNGKRDVAGARQALARLERAHPDFPRLAELKQSVEQAGAPRR